MKNIYIYIILFINSINLIVTGQAPNWVWAKGASGAVEAIGNSTSTDINGNVYITGSYNGRMIDFGNVIFTNTDTSGGSNDIFILKYNSSGALIWAKSAGGTKDDAGNGICTDIHGNVYVTGSFSSASIAFDSDTLINSGVSAIFFVKFDSLGNVIWTRSASGTGLIGGKSISADANENVYVTGNLTPSGVFGTDTLYGNMFVSKFDLIGNISWAKGIGGGSNGNGIGTDAYGNVYVAGYFSSTAITFDSIILSNAGGHESFFLVKYGITGKAVWAKSATSTSLANGVSTDAHGNIFITGFFSDSDITFGNDTLKLNATGGTNIFTAKYDSSGNEIWATTTGGCDHAYAASVSTDSLGNCFVIGSSDLASSCVFVFGNDFLVSYSHIFIVKYDTMGNVLWAQSPLELYEDNINQGWSISTDPYDNAYITGNFMSTALAFGNDTVRRNSSSYNVFIAKVGNSSLTDIKDGPNASEKINVYPNPSNGEVYFSGSINGSFVEVFNVLGEMIYTTEVNTYNNYLLTLNGKAKGVYFYRIIDNAANIQQGKIILE